MAEAGLGFVVVEAVGLEEGGGRGGLLVVCGGVVVGSVDGSGSGGGGGVGFKAALIPDRAGLLVVVVGEELRVRRVDERRAFNCMI